MINVDLDSDATWASYHKALAVNIELLHVFDGQFFFFFHHMLHHIWLHNSTIRCRYNITSKDQIYSIPNTICTLVLLTDVVVAITLILVN